MSQLNVRELLASDIPFIVRYWTESDPAFMVGMGVDLAKLPTADAIRKMLEQQLALPIEQKPSFCLIWEAGGTPVGHSNVNQIQFGASAFMHLHLWQSTTRQRGMGLQLVQLGLPIFFERLQLQTLYCEPFANNPAPNKTLKKAGFEFVKTHITVPGSHNFEQPVNRWRFTRAQLSP